MDWRVTTSPLRSGSQRSSALSPCAEICWNDNKIGLESWAIGRFTSTSRWSLLECPPLCAGVGLTCWSQMAAPGGTMSLQRCLILSVRCIRSCARMRRSLGCGWPRAPCGSSQVRQSTTRKCCRLRWTAALSAAKRSSGCSFQLGGGMTRPPSGSGMKSSKSKVRPAFGRQVKGKGFESKVGSPSWLIVVSSLSSSMRILRKVPCPMIWTSPLSQSLWPCLITALLSTARCCPHAWKTVLLIARTGTGVTKGGSGSPWLGTNCKRQRACASGSGESCTTTAKVDLSMTGGGLTLCRAKKSRSSWSAHCALSNCRHEARCVESTCNVRCSRYTCLKP